MAVAQFRFARILPPRPRAIFRIFVVPPTSTFANGVAGRLQLVQIPSFFAVGRRCWEVDCLGAASAVVLVHVLQRRGTARWAVICLLGRRQQNRTRSFLALCLNRIGEERVDVTLLRGHHWAIEKGHPDAHLPTYSKPLNLHPVRKFGL